MRRNDSQGAARTENQILAPGLVIGVGHEGSPIESAHDTACVLDLSLGKKVLDFVEGEPRREAQLHAPFDLALELLKHRSPVGLGARSERAPIDHALALEPAP